jgi:hypothetical protein
MVSMSVSPVYSIDLGVQVLSVSAHTQDNAAGVPSTEKSSQKYFKVLFFYNLFSCRADSEESSPPATSVNCLCVTNNAAVLVGF